MSVSSVNTIYKKRQQILDNYVRLNPKTKKARSCGYPKIEECLRQWFDNKRSEHVSLNGPILLEQAKKLSKKASTGWLEKWKKRHGIKLYTMKGESAAVDYNVVNTWLKNIWPPLRQAYGDEDIYNCDETTLFYKLLPKKHHEKDRHVQEANCPRKGSL